MVPQKRCNCVFFVLFVLPCLFFNFKFFCSFILYLLCSKLSLSRNGFLAFEINQAFKKSYPVFFTSLLCCGPFFPEIRLFILAFFKYYWCALHMFKCYDLIVSPGIEPGYFIFPSQNNYVVLFGVLLSCEKFKNF